jgi:hypothetical protein
MRRTPQGLPGGGQSLETGRRCGRHIPLPQALARLIQDTDVHGPGVQVKAPGEGVLLGGQSPEVSSAGGCEAWPSASIPRRSAEEGASIRINTLQRTGRTVAAHP